MNSASVASSALPAHLPTRLLVDGAWSPGGDGSFQVHNPATGAVLGEVADASPDDALRALTAADGAAAEWRRTPPRVRSELLRAVFDRMVAQTDDIAALITAEGGKPLAESRAEVAYGAEFVRWYSE